MIWGNAKCDFSSCRKFATLLFPFVDHFCSHQQNSCIPAISSASGQL